MAIPALQALTQLGLVTVHAPAWGADLYRDLDVLVHPRGTLKPNPVAVVFPPSLRSAWQARRCARRFGSATDFRRWLLTDVVDTHPRTADHYRLLAEAVGGTVQGDPAWAPRDTDRSSDVPDGHIGIVPVSPSGAVREWGGWRALADQLPVPVVFYGGPGEQEAVARVAGPHPQVVGLPLPAFAATLQRCALLVCNDSGPAHFGRAVGVPVVTVFGSTTFARTGAPGAVAVEGPSMDCRPCYGRRCHVGGQPCLDIAVARVRMAVDEVRGV